MSFYFTVKRLSPVTGETLKHQSMGSTRQATQCMVFNGVTKPIDKT
uniref:Uncharacterized protein n=1 Tax=Anguilla anguilla TaxID=7936 RepID=A0A0E9TB75_ANGAN